MKSLLRSTILYRVGAIAPVSTQLARLSGLLLSLSALVCSGITLSATLLLSPAAAQETAPQEATEAFQLLQQGFEQISLGQMQDALAAFQQALAFYQSADNLQGEAYALLGIGRVYAALGQRQEALDVNQEALALLIEVGDRTGEGTALNNIGLIYLNFAQYEEALDYYQQARVILEEQGDQTILSQVLGNIGGVYYSQGQYEQALDYYNQALNTHIELGNREEEGVMLNNIAGVYVELGQFERALSYYQQALDVLTELGSRPGVGYVLNFMGLVYVYQGQYEQALETLEQARAIRLEVGDRPGLAQTLVNMALVQLNEGQYEQALETLLSALEIAREVGDRVGESATLTSIAEIYRQLGQYERALAYYEQVYATQAEVGHRAGLGQTLNNMGVVYSSLEQYEQALDAYQQALELFTELGNRREQGFALGNIGTIYQYAGQYEQALEYYQRSLAIRREVGDRPGESVTLLNLGIVYTSLKQYEPALEAYQQSLALLKELGDRYREAMAFSNLGYTLESMGEQELAIVFLKQSVNRLEEIRGNIRGLPTEEQQVFADSISEVYRKLADLLLQADRVLEAQRVLDLLQVQELDEYLQDVQRNANTETGIGNRPPEQQIQDDIDALLNRSITISRELRELEDLPTLTPAQEERLIALGREAEQLIQSFNDFWDSETVQVQVAQLRQTTGGESIDLSNYRDLQQSLAALEQNAVLLYPFILDDRLELVLVSPDADTPIRETIPVDRVTLNGAIANYRSALESADSDPLPLAQQLYGWLLAELEDELQALGAETIIYAPDGQLRYIPLGALHDGDQWAIQRFRINNITAASLMDLTRSPDSEPRIFAGAFTEGTYTVPVGDRSIPFEGLEFAGREVENLAALIPNTTQRLNDDFHPDTVSLMNRYTIVHLATHASFVPGTPEESFILFGDGTPVSLSDVANWRLPDVELVVLSACETGVGDELGDGREILGLGYQMQQAGADAAIASLWSVSDGGTQVLMDAFYAALNNGYSKAEALQRAQIALITSDQTVLEGERGVTVEITDLRTGQALAQSDDLAHPYYWAPFILIGNGL